MKHLVSAATRIIFYGLFILSSMICVSAFAEDAEKIYSYQNPSLFEPALDELTSGIGNRTLGPLKDELAKGSSSLENVILTEYDSLAASNQLAPTTVVRMAIAAFSLSLSSLTAPAFEEETVNIYSYRQPPLIEPVLKAFTANTGIKTKVLFLDKGLEERILAEGENSPADVILTVDIARLTSIVNKGLTQPINEESINLNIPAEYRDPNGHWFGLTKRGRVVYASKERVPQNEITYKELADPKWKGKICMRSGQHNYNLDLLSSVIVHEGLEKAERWLRGVKANLARKPEGGDMDQAKAIFSRECDIAIGNTYYVGQMLTNEKEPEQKEWASAIKVIFPDAVGRGTHVNVSGMAMAKYAPNKASALALMTFLAGEDAQKIYAEKVFEYPVDPEFAPSDLVAGFGPLKADSLPLADIAKHRKAASEMVDRVAFDDGRRS